MKKPAAFVLHGFGLLLLVTILALGWWLAGGADARRPTTARTRSPATLGPQDPAYCAVPGAPLPPPPIDNPFGLHLYATTPRGIVTPLQAMEIVNYLGLSQGFNSSTTLPLKPQSSVASEPPSNITKNETAFDDVQSVSTLLQEYRRAFGAMPVGEFNDEIVRRLQGENPKGIAVLPKTHPAINAQGELIDRWGMPYRFHPESAWSTTVRSSGADRKMWTQDDVLSETLMGDVVQR